MEDRKWHSILEDDYPKLLKVVVVRDRAKGKLRAVKRALNAFYTGKEWFIYNQGPTIKPVPFDIDEWSYL